MNFIETMFGVSPDGGDGSLELLLYVIVLVTIAVGLFVIRRPLVLRR